MEALKKDYEGYTFDRLREICREKDWDTEKKSKAQLIEMLCDESISASTSQATPQTPQPDPMVQMMRMMQEQMHQQAQMMQKQIFLQEERQRQWQKEQQELMLTLVEKSKPDETKPRLPKPTLQKMTEGENVENFLDMFEKVATQQRWPRDVWSTQLAGLLTGKALAAFVNVPKEQTGDYDTVKKAILRRYDVNAETYRQRFRNNRRKGFETYKELADRSKDFFKKWRDASELDLEEMVLVEQFLQSVPEDLRVWLKERKPESQEKAAELADDYVLARKNDPRENNIFRQRRPFIDDEQITKPAPDDRPIGKRLMDDIQTSTTKPDGREITSKPDKPDTKGADGREITSKPDKTNTKGEKQCYYCKKFGHLMYSCPEKKHDTTEASVKSAYFSEVCHNVPWNTDSHKYIKRGKIDGTSVRMLVDTGCDTTMVRATIVKQEKWDHNNTATVMCVHGDKVSYPSAMVDIEMDGVLKTLEVTLAPELPSGLDVLVGRDVLIGKESENAETQSFAVKTRAKAKQEKEVSAKAKTNPPVTQPLKGDNETIVPKDEIKGLEDPLLYRSWRPRDSAPG